MKRLTVGLGMLVMTLLCVSLPHAETDSLSAPKEAAAIAEAYGVSGFDQVDSLKFTFNVLKGKVAVKRSWEWEPKTQQVTLQTTDQGTPLRVSYHRNSLNAGNTALNTKADAWFINDQYWLLFPFHLVWDKGTQLSAVPNQPLPIPPGQGGKLTITFTSGGYTPGDMYDLFYGPDHLIRQWMYHKGGSAEPTMTTTWEKNSQLGPLTVALEHHDASGKFHLWFSDVALRRSGKPDWETSSPISPK